MDTQIRKVIAALPSCEECVLIKIKCIYTSSGKINITLVKEVDP